MNSLGQKLFNPKDGIFHEFEGIKACFKPSGMIQIHTNLNTPWYGLIPQTPDFLGAYNHYTGGMNLVFT